MVEKETYDFSIMMPIEDERGKTDGTIVLKDGTAITFLSKPDTGVVLSFPKNIFAENFREQIEDPDKRTISIMFEQKEVLAIIEGTTRLAEITRDDDTEEEKDKGGRRT